jgi:hypothetical protein
VSDFDIRKRAEYLNYIDRLQARALLSRQASGLSVWALLVAAIYIVWSTWEIAPGTLSEAIELNYFLLAYLFILSLFTGLMFVAHASYGSHDKISMHSLYIRQNTPNFFIVFTILLSVGMALAGGLYAVISLSYSQAIHANWSTWIVFSLMIMLFFGLLVTAPQILISNKKKGRLDPTLFKSKFSNPPLANATILFLGGLLIILSASWSLVYYSYAALSDNVARIALLSFNSSLITVVFFCLIRSLNLGNYVEILDLLERDIVFERVEIKDIALRIAADVIGHHVGDWLRQRTYDAMARKTEMETILAEWVERKEEIGAIPDQYMFERIRRVRDFVERYKKANDTYVEEVNYVVSCIEESLSSPFSYARTVFGGLIQEIHDQLKDDLNRLGKQHEKFFQETEAILAAADKAC